MFITWPSILNFYVEEHVVSFPFQLILDFFNDLVIRIKPDDNVSYLLLYFRQHPVRYFSSFTFPPNLPLSSSADDRSFIGQVLNHREFAVVTTL